MTIDLKKTVLAMGLAALVSVPFIAKADGVNLSLNLNDDNEAHFHFKDHSIKHHPEMWAGAKELIKGKEHLWKAQGDFGGHRETALQDINSALDEIRLADDHAMGR